MARASRPSRMEPAISAIATLTRSGTTNASPVGVSIFSFWYFLVTAVPCRWGLGGRPTPTSRPGWAGGRPLNFYETPDNLRVGLRTGGARRQAVGAWSQWVKKDH